MHKGLPWGGGQVNGLWGPYPETIATYFNPCIYSVRREAVCIRISFENRVLKNKKKSLKINVVMREKALPCSVTCLRAIDYNLITNSHHWQKWTCNCPCGSLFFFACVRSQGSIVCKAVVAVSLFSVNYFREVVICTVIYYVEVEIYSQGKSSPLRDNSGLI